MEHQTLAALSRRATVLRAPLLLSSKKALLSRWADLLDAAPSSKAELVHGFEFASEHSAILKQEWSHNTRSPFRVAYADPELRAAGFVSGSYEEAIRFFELSDREAHYLLCDCHYAPAATFKDVARRVRRVAQGPLLLTAGDWRIFFPLLLIGCMAAGALLAQFMS